MLPQQTLAVPLFLPSPPQLPHSDGVGLRERTAGVDDLERGDEEEEDPPPYDFSVASPLPHADISPTDQSVMVSISNRQHDRRRGVLSVFRVGLFRGRSTSEWEEYPSYADVPPPTPPPIDTPEFSGSPSLVPPLLIPPPPSQPATTMTTPVSQRIDNSSVVASTSPSLSNATYEARRSRSPSPSPPTAPPTPHILSSLPPSPPSTDVTPTGVMTAALTGEAESPMMVRAGVIGDEAVEEDGRGTQNIPGELTSPPGLR